MIEGMTWPKPKQPFTPRYHVTDAGLQRAMQDIDSLTDLAHDLATVLSHMVVGWENIIGQDLAQHPEAQRVMARYREALC